MQHQSINYVIANMLRGGKSCLSYLPKRKSGTQKVKSRQKGKSRVLKNYLKKHSRTKYKSRGHNK